LHATLFLGRGSDCREDGQSHYNCVLCIDRCIADVCCQRMMTVSQVLTAAMQPVSYTGRLVIHPEGNTWFIANETCCKLLLSLRHSLLLF